MNILNLGCGNDMYGTHRVDMFETPATTHVVDISKNKLPFPDFFFDEVKMYGVLEHVSNVGFLLNEVYRVCKVGAYVDVSTDHAGWIFWYTNKREHNKYLNHYYEIDNFKHSQGSDKHLYLFVESHLQGHFSKFSRVNVTYGYHGKNAFIRFLLRCLPNKWGAREIKVLALK